MKRVAATGTAVIALSMSLAACSSGVALRPTNDASTGANAQTSSAAVAPAAPTTTGGAESTSSDSSTVSATDEGSGVVTAKLGTAHTYSDGLQVSVSKPSKYAPSAYAAHESTSAAYARFTVTIVNGTGKGFNPLAFSMFVRSGGREGDQIFDSANGIERAPDNELPPGAQASFNVGFGVAKPSDLAVQVNPSFDYPGVLFTS